MIIFPVVSFAKLTIQAEIFPKEITLEEEATITVTVKGGSATKPVIPKLQGIDIINTGSSTRSESLIFNGKVTTNLISEYTYTVVASQRGSFKIPHFSVFSQGIEYKSNSLTLNVVRNTQNYSNQNQNTQNHNSTTNQVQQFPSDLFWITTTVSKTNPYVFEQILYKFKIYSRTNIQIGQPVLPNFDDFIVEKVVDEKKGQEVINGETYVTFETIYALFPLKQGTVKLNSANIKIQYTDRTSRNNQRNGPYNNFFNDPFFNKFFNQGHVVTKVLSSKGSELQIQALPSPIPDDFTGLVGEFAAKGSLSKTDIKTGDSITLEIHISGKGNIQDAKLPEFEVKGLKIYKDKPLTKIDKNQYGITGLKTFKYAMVANQPGNYKIPMSLSYLNTGTGHYEHWKLSDQIQFSVTGDSKQNLIATTPQNSQNKNNKNSMIINNKGVAPLFFDHELIQEWDELFFSDALFYLLIGGLISFSMAAFVFKMIKRGKKSERKIKLNKQYKEIQKILSKEQIQVEQLISEISKVVSILIDDDLKTVTPMDLDKLNGFLKEDEINQFKKLLEALEASRYGLGDGVISPDIKKKIIAILKLLRG